MIPPNAPKYFRREIHYESETSTHTALEFGAARSITQAEPRSRGRGGNVRQPAFCPQGLRGRSRITQEAR